MKNWSFMGVWSLKTLNYTFPLQYSRTVFQLYLHKLSHPDLSVCLG